MRIVPIDANRIPMSLEDFVQHLRSYKKNSIVAYGSMMLWSLFYSEDIDKCVDKAIITKITLLALATGNNFRSKEIKNASEFYDLCKQFLHIPVTIEDKEFLENETQRIKDALNNKSIPEKYVNLHILRKITFDLYLQRGVVEQNYHVKMRVTDFFTDYEVLRLLDEKHNGMVSEIYHDIFGLSLKQIFRSAYALFAIAEDNVKNGIFNLEKVNIEDEVKEKFKIDLEACQIMASKLSCKESELRRIWYEKKVLSQSKYYQRYVSTPLNENPIIHLDKKNPENQWYCIPAPDLFIRGFRQTIFSYLYKNYKNFGNFFGKATESHIFRCLKEIFGTEKVKKIEYEGKKADFIIQLNTVNLIIEVKVDIGGALSKTVADPSSIAALWSRLYGAYEQGKASLEYFRTENRKNIFIILIGEHITAEYLSFQSFGKQSKLFKDMDIESVKLFSWAAFENLLWNMSLEAFEEYITGNSEEMTSEFMRRQNKSNAEKTKPRFTYFEQIQREFLKN